MIFSALKSFPTEPFISALYKSCMMQATKQPTIISRATVINFSFSDLPPYLTAPAPLPPGCKARVQLNSDVQVWCLFFDWL